jgi:hypothetical protein
MRKIIAGWFLFTAALKAAVLVPVGIVLLWMAGALVWNAGEKDRLLYLIIGAALILLAGRLAFGSLAPLVGHQPDSNRDIPASKFNRLTPLSQSSKSRKRRSH